MVFYRCLEWLWWHVGGATYTYCTVRSSSHASEAKTENPQGGWKGKLANKTSEQANAWSECLSSTHFYMSFRRSIGKLSLALPEDRPCPCSSCQGEFLSNALIFCSHDSTLVGSHPKCAWSQESQAFCWLPRRRIYYLWHHLIFWPSPGVIHFHPLRH